MKDSYHFRVKSKKVLFEFSIKRNKLLLYRNHVIKIQSPVFYGLTSWMLLL